MAGREVVVEWLAPGLDVVFVGINPGLWSAATRCPFAHPGSRFWPALRDGGFTGRLLAPWQRDAFLAAGLGLCNAVDRATARVAELSAAELRAGGAALGPRLAPWSPRWVAVLGVTGWRQAFGEPRATVGPQDRRIGGARTWVLPNPSGLNAHFTPPRLAEEFRRLHDAVRADGDGPDRTGRR